MNCLAWSTFSRISLPIFSKSVENIRRYSSEKFRRYSSEKLRRYSSEKLRITPLPLNDVKNFRAYKISKSERSPYQAPYMATNSTSLLALQYDLEKYEKQNQQQKESIFVQQNNQLVEAFDILKIELDIVLGVLYVFVKRKVKREQRGMDPVEHRKRSQY